MTNPIRRNDVEKIFDNLEKAFPQRRGSDLPMSTSCLNKIESERNESIEKNKQAIDYYDLAVSNLYNGDFKKAEENIAKYKFLRNYDSFPKYDRRLLDNPELSVIIVAYNTGFTLVDCVESLLSNNDGNYEIIIVDNGGNEKVVEKLLGFRLLYISSPHNFRPSEGRNIGAYFAKGRILAFLDDDAIVGKGYVRTIIELFKKYEIIWLRGKILPKTNHYRNKEAGHNDLGNTCKFITYVNTESNCAISKNEYVKLNGMDPLLFNHEGVELSYRIKISYGLKKILYSPDIIVYHDYANTNLKYDIKMKRNQVMMSYLKFIHPAIEDFISDLYCFNINAKQGKLIMTLLVRNEEDIVRYNIDFHLIRGVDFIIATDNGSTDGTLDILHEYEKKGVLRLIEEPQHNHNQAVWNNRMAQMARDEYDADFIFHCDADEFWFPRSGSLKREITSRSEDILSVNVTNVLLADRDGKETFPNDARYAVVQPIIAENYEEETKSGNLFFYQYPPKVIFKTAKKMLLVQQGNHAVTNKDDMIKQAISQDIVIYHYPVRSKVKFIQKTIMGGSAYEKIKNVPKSYGFHKRRWYEMYKKGLLEQEYKKLIIDDIEADNFMREGFIEEVDFEEIIKGQKRTLEHWRYYNRQFEYEESFHDCYWAWAGHKRFGYDLIRNVKPQTIVELGTHKGTSFFSFCQAVKDAYYDANLFSIDTWQGDEHAGVYNERVFKEVNEIKEKYYGSLNIKLLRKTFDEVLDEFDNNSIDLLHIDGLHTYSKVKNDFENWFPKVKNDGIILLHDIFISRDDFEVYKFWDELKSKYKTIEFHQSYGLGVLFKGSALYQTLIDRERELQIRYSYIAEDKKNDEMRMLSVSFEKSLADRDKQVAVLNQAIEDKDNHITNFTLIAENRQDQIEKLTSEMQDFLQSTSWRITAPLRWPVHQVKRLITLFKIGPAVSKIGGGYIKTGIKAISVFHREGMKGIKRRVLKVQQSAGHYQVVAGKNDIVDRNDYAEWIRRYDTLTDESRARMRDRIDDFVLKPLISVLMPVYNPKPKWLIEAIESVRNQIYPCWELCIADDASTDKRIRPILEDYARNDKRIKVVFRKKNGHISAASNSALELVSGEWVALLDNDDLIAEHALFWVADTIDKNPDACLIYSDEDKITHSGKRFDPYFKCNWNEDLFYSQNMICHLGVYRADLLKEICGFREGLEGAQDYDLALRYVERISPTQLHHIPRVLYHWRAHAESTAKSGEAKRYALLAGEKALNEYFQRQGVNVTAALLDFGMYHVSYALPNELPLVSLIVPTRNNQQLLKKCIESIIENTAYTNYEILIVDNGSDDAEAMQYFKKQESSKKVRVLRDGRLFNFSALNNAAVKVAHGEIIGLLNDDLEVISAEWLSEMVSHALRPDVGAVGARLWYPDNTLQHGGIVIGIGGVAGHSQKYLPKGMPGYFGRANLTQNYTAVTAACLVIRKTIYEEVGGFNESALQIAFNDVDFCLRVHEKGYRNVWTPYAELYHHESASRGWENTPEKQKRFSKEVAYIKQRWGDKLLNDRAYSPNLTLDYEDFSLAWPPRIELI